MSAREDIGWAIHNLLGHPVSEIVHWGGYIWPRLNVVSEWIHDITVPTTTTK